MLLFSFLKHQATHYDNILEYVSVLLYKIVRTKISNEKYICYLIYDDICHCYNKCCFIHRMNIKYISEMQEYVNLKIIFLFLNNI